MNLELVPRDELIDELARRYPTIILGLHAPITGGTSNRMCWFQGDPMIALGLGEMLKAEMIQRIRSEEQIDPEQTGGRG